MSGKVSAEMRPEDSTNQNVPRRLRIVAGENPEVSEKGKDAEYNTAGDTEDSQNDGTS